MATATMNISLPDTMKAEVEQIVANEGYGNTSEFFRDLVRNYLKQRQERELETLLLARLKDTDDRVFNIDDVRGEVVKRAQAKVRRYVKGSPSLVDELIAERRAEAERD
jgi:antitoxin ParD1/3/4